MGIIVIILCVLVVFYCIGRFSQGDGFHARYKAGTILMLGDMTASDKLDEIELHDVSMRLNPGEACYFEGEGYSYHSKDIVTGYRSSSHGSSMRIMRGYSIHELRPISHKEQLSTASDSAILIDIMRKKAKLLNEQFPNLNWTPRKFDMALWAYEK